MRKRLTRHGNSLALIIEKPILDLLGISSETELEMATDGRNLVISPVANPEQREQRVDDIIAEAHRRFPNALKRLAGGDEIKSVSRNDP